jgi:anti-sigma B factor antagonist
MASRRKVSVGGGNSYFEIDVTSAGGVCTVALKGEADVLSAAKIEAAIEGTCEADDGLIVVDLSGLKFIDSSGLQAIVAGHERCLARAQELVIVPGPRSVQRLFEITGLDTILPFRDGSSGG